MKVKLKVTRPGIGKIGEVVDVPDTKAAVLIGRGWAHESEEKKSAKKKVSKSTKKASSKTTG